MLNTSCIIVGLHYIGSKVVDEDKMAAMFCRSYRRAKGSLQLKLPGCVWNALFQGKRKGNKARKITLNLAIPAIIRLL